MNEQERKIITDNMDLLIQQTNDKDLALELWQSDVISQTTYDSIKFIEDDKERKHCLFREILSSRSRSVTFCNIIKAFVKTGHFDLAKILKPDVNLESYFTDNLDGSLRPSIDDEVSSLTNYVHDLRLMPSKLIINVKKAAKRYDLLDSPFDPYVAGCRPKGYLLMINNVEFVNSIHEYREGAIVDESNMNDLFEQLGFKVIIYRNQGYQDMLRKIDEFKDMKELKQVSCVFVAILSHGRSHPMSINESMVTSSDGQNILCSDIYNRFSNETCPQLINTPKVFIFQCCRGEQFDYGIRDRPLRSRTRTRDDGYPQSEDFEEPVRFPRLITDMLISYATLPGFKANRDIFLGTWFINKICEVFMEHAKDMHVEEMFRLVDLKLAQLRSEGGLHQTSMYENRGFRPLYLSPGLDDFTESSNNNHETPSEAIGM